MRSLMEIVCVLMIVVGFAMIVFDLINAQATASLSKTTTKGDSRTGAVEVVFKRFQRSGRTGF